MRASERFRYFVVAAVVACCAVAGIAVAQPNEDPQARLRSALREATVRVRQLEDENATLQAKQAELDRDHLALTQKAAASEKGLQALRGQAASGQAALQRAADAQKESLAKWEAAYKEAASTAQARDADAKRMEAALVALREQNRLAEEKNAKLYQLGHDLIALYQNKKVLEVLGAGEPVTKLKRVEYENVVQDYEDKLRDSRVTHPAPR
jgi:chromosome segregation ATPase